MNASRLFRPAALALTGLLIGIGLVRPEDSYLSDSLSLFNFSDMNPGDSAPAEEGVKPLLRGPVHEAYASLATVNPLPGPIASKEPPTALKETPPANKPAGDNIQWLPGYWAWDDEGNNYLWVSGLWRAVPPTRQWLPGNWHKLDGNQGWQWVSGLWGPAEQGQVKLLPPPPAPKEEEPGTPPSEDNLFSPGCWVYRDTGYEWREGFWYKADPDWVLVPAHYVWTPAGHIFVEEYWDWSLRNRGLLFAPVRIDEALLKRGDWSFEPKHAVDDQSLLGALFTRPSLGWYYFGDFFDPRYNALGYFSWFFHGDSPRAPGHAFDPLFPWYGFRFRNRNDFTWQTQLRALYLGRRKNTAPRPPGDLRQQANLIRSLQEGKAAAGSALVRFGLLVGPLQKVDRKVINLRALDKEGQGKARQAAEKLQTVGDQRAQQQSRLIQEGKAPLKGNAAPASLKLDLPKGPAVRGNANGQPPQRVDVRATTTQLQKEKETRKQQEGQLAKGPAPQGRPQQPQGNQGQPRQPQGNQGQPQGNQGQPRQPQGNQGQPRQPQGNQGRPQRPLGNQGQPRQPQGNQGQPRQPQGNQGRLQRPQGPPARLPQPGRPATPARPREQPARPAVPQPRPQAARPQQPIRPQPRPQPMRPAQQIPPRPPVVQSRPQVRPQPRPSRPSVRPHR